MIDLSTFTQQELPAFAIWLKTAGLHDEARQVVAEHTKRLDDDLARIKKQIREERKTKVSNG